MIDHSHGGLLRHEFVQQVRRQVEPFAPEGAVASRVSHSLRVTSGYPHRKSLSRLIGGVFEFCQRVVYDEAFN